MRIGRVIAIGAVLLLAGVGTIGTLYVGSSPVTPEQDLALGKSHYWEQCRQYSKSDAQARSFCGCMMSTLDPRLKSGDEYRMASDLTESVVSAGRLFAKVVMKTKINSVSRKYQGKVPLRRANHIWDTVRTKGPTCARTAFG